MRKILFVVISLFICSIGLCQNVGIGVTSPLARLHVADSNVLFTAQGNLPASPALPPISGSGRRFMWYSDKGALRAGHSGGSNWDRDSVGNYSIALGFGAKAKGEYGFAAGYQTSAVGEYATALGRGNEALGDISTAMGYGNLALGNYSTALGFANIASGDRSTVFGYNNIATGFATFAIGTNNDPVVSEQTFSSNSTPLFIIGNGGHSGARRNAMLVRKDGRVGIGTDYPTARLHIADSSVLFSAPSSAPATPMDPPASGIGRRMMWYADKAAFRAGHSPNTNWDKDSIGKYSAAFGYGSKAKGDFSFATGLTTEATGLYSFAAGREVTASGNYSFAMGNSVAAGGNNSFAIGTNSNAGGIYAIAMGASANASGDFSMAMGNTTNANGELSVTMGRNTIANGYSSLVVGMFNEPVYAPQTSENAFTPLFIVGNGTSATDRSNALIVRKDGRVGVGTNLPLSTLHVRQVGAGGGLTLENDTDGNKWRIYSASGDNNLTFYNNANTEIADIDDVTGTYSALSDSRLKKDIEPLQPVLPLVMQLEPSLYHFKWQAKTDRKEIGMMAQHTRSFFPSLVSFDAEKDLYKMNYAGFSTVAIKAIQEQQVIIEQQAKSITDLQKKVENLEQLINGKLR